MGILICQTRFTGRCQHSAHQQVFFMLQIVNDAKSMPFVHLLAIKNPCTPPSNQKALIFGKLCKTCQPFSTSDHGKWNSQNLQQIAQNPLNLPTLTMNQVKFTQSAPISRGSLYPWAKLSKLVTIHTFWQITQNLPTIF